MQGPDKFLAKPYIYIQSIYTYACLYKIIHMYIYIYIYEDVSIYVPIKQTFLPSVKNLYMYVRKTDFLSN
jgi:hypothetical protein